MTESEPWKDKDFLIEEYYEKEKSLPEIAEETGGKVGSIGYWMEKYDLDRRSVGEDPKPWASFFTSKEGYEGWSAGNDYASVHQLLLIANGEDPYDVYSDGKYVTHHINKVKWDNRPENIILESIGAHASYHNRQGDIGVKSHSNN